MIHTLTREEALAVLTSGLNRWEDYCNPSELCMLIPADTMDSVWDVELYLVPNKINGPLGCYAGEKTRWANKKYNGQRTIHITAKTEYMTLRTQFYTN